MEMDEAMKWVMERGGVKGVVVENDALCVTLKKVQTQLLVLEKEIVRFKGTQAQHSTNYIELSQKVKTVKIFLFATKQAKSTLDNWVQTLQKELIQKGVKLVRLQQALEKEQQVHQALKDKPLQLKGYDDVMDQWVLDEPKVCLYEDFIWIGKPITTKVYNSTWDSLTKAFQAKVVQYRTQIQDLQSQLDEQMELQDASKEEEEPKGDLGSVNLALVGVVTLNFGQAQVGEGPSTLDKDIIGVEPITKVNTP